MTNPADGAAPKSSGVGRADPPPRWVVAIANPVFRRAIRSQLGARLPIALLCFTGRRTGRSFEIPVGAYDVAEGVVVVTDAPWLANFKGEGRQVRLVRSGRTTTLHGTLVEDPAVAGRLLRSVLDAGASPRQLGMSLPPGHRLTDEEAARMRKVILLRQ